MTSAISNGDLPTRYFRTLADPQKNLFSGRVILREKARASGKLLLVVGEKVNWGLPNLLSSSRWRRTDSKEKKHSQFAYWLFALSCRPRRHLYPFLLALVRMPIFPWGVLLWQLCWTYHALPDELCSPTRKKPATRCVHVNPTNRRLCEMSVNVL